MRGRSQTGEGPDMDGVPAIRGYFQTRAAAYKAASDAGMRLMGSNKIIDTKFRKWHLCQVDDRHGSPHAGEWYWLPQDPPRLRNGRFR